jgi:hypothetical protein
MRIAGCACSPGVDWQDHQVAGERQGVCVLQVGPPAHAQSNPLQKRVVIGGKWGVTMCAEAPQCLVMPCAQRPWGTRHPGHADGRLPVRRQAGQDAAQEGGREVRPIHLLVHVLRK